MKYYFPELEKIFTDLLNENKLTKNMLKDPFIKTYSIDIKESEFLHSYNLFDLLFNENYELEDLNIYFKEYHGNDFISSIKLRIKSINNLKVMISDSSPSETNIFEFSEDEKYVLNMLKELKKNSYITVEDDYIGLLNITNKNSLYNLLLLIFEYWDNLLFGYKPHKNIMTKEFGYNIINYDQSILRNYLMKFINKFLLETDTINIIPKSSKFNFTEQIRGANND